MEVQGEVMEHEVEFLPELVHDFNKTNGKGITFPACIQPKLDGVRCIAFWKNGEVVLGTRSGKIWEAPSHINKELEAIMPERMVLDGELYTHDLSINFETLTSWAKKKQPETCNLEYHVFDSPIDEHGNTEQFSVRALNLSLWFIRTKSKRNKVKCVENKEVCTKNDVYLAEKYYTQQGYEGAIVRDLEGKYSFGKRSWAVQKVKTFRDEEFEVVDFEDGQGRDNGCVIWICTTEDGKRFHVKPKETLERRKELYEEGSAYIGKYLKVGFQNYTKNGIPRFPIGIGFRDEEDR